MTPVETVTQSSWAVNACLSLLPDLKLDQIIVHAERVSAAVRPEKGGD